LLPGDDWYRVTQPVTTDLIITITFNNSGNDLDLQAYDALTQELRSSSAGLSGRESVTLVGASTARDILIRVKLFGGSLVPYTLTIEKRDGSSTTSSMGASSQGASSTGASSGGGASSSAVSGIPPGMCLVQGTPASSSAGGSSSGGTASSGVTTCTDAFEPNQSPSMAATLTLTGPITTFLAASCLAESPSSSSSGGSSSGGVVCTNDTHANNAQASATQITLNGNTGTAAGTACPNELDWFKVTVPGDNAVTLDLTGVPVDGDLDLYAHDATGAELGRSNGTTSVETLHFLQVHGTRDIWVKVKSYAHVAVGYTVTVTLTPVTPPAVDLCAAAQVLTPGGIVHGDTSLSFNDLEFTSDTCVTGSNAGPDDFYSVALGMGQTLTATLVPVGLADLQLHLLTSCSDLCCWAGMDEGGAGAQEVLSYHNVTNGPQTLILVVDTFLDESSAGAYDLTVAVQ
jgi:hypothetical protein